MIEQLPIKIESGDLLPPGSGLVGPIGLAGDGALIPWAQITSFQRLGMNQRWRRGRGLAGAAGAGLAASALLGPIGVATAAAIVGVSAGLSTREIVKVECGDRHAILSGPRGLAAQAAEWAELARLHRAGAVTSIESK